jgi:hypothetical protein
MWILSQLILSQLTHIYHRYLRKQQQKERDRVIMFSKKEVLF